VRFLLIAAVVLLAVPPHQSRLADETLASITIDTFHPGWGVSPTFIGFSHEWSVAQQLMGAPATGTNPMYRQLVGNLLAYGGGPLSVRVGGNSTDSTVEPVPGVVDPFARLYLDAGAEFILGVNLGAGNLPLAIDQARAYVQGMPAGSLEAIEIGNEPDLFHDNGHRAPSYAYSDYANEFASWRSTINPLLLSGTGLVGPSWSSAFTLKNLPEFLDAEGRYLTLVSHHWYAGTQCNGKTNPSDYLLRPDASTSGARAVAPSVRLAHERGLAFRMGEMNSISCGGEAGVSDVFASALWSADALFELANVGVDGVNVHTGNGGGYALFTFTTSATPDGVTYGIGSIRPEYYGLLLFQEAAPARSQLLPVTRGASANVKAWATVSPDGSIRVLVINKDESRAGNVVVTIPGHAARPGVLTRLQAPTLDAQTDITLGGQTFDGSPDGTLQGTPSSEAVVPASDAYTFSMTPVSAALLTLGG
jgi:hypothetical protein